MANDTVVDRYIGRGGQFLIRGDSTTNAKPWKPIVKYGPTTISMDRRNDSGLTTCNNQEVCKFGNEFILDNFEGVIINVAKGNTNPTAGFDNLKWWPVIVG